MHKGLRAFMLAYLWWKWDRYYRYYCIGTTYTLTPNVWLPALCAVARTMAHCSDNNRNHTFTNASSHDTQIPYKLYEPTRIFIFISISVVQITLWIPRTSSASNQRNAPTITECLLFFSFCLFLFFILFFSCFPSLLVSGIRTTCRRHNQSFALKSFLPRTTRTREYFWASDWTDENVVFCNCLMRVVLYKCETFSLNANSFTLDGFWCGQCVCTHTHCSDKVQAGWGMRNSHWVWSVEMTTG